MTISGVKSLINLDIYKLDDSDDHSLKADYIKENLKSRSKLILEKIKKIKKYGKKNSSKSSYGSGKYPDSKFIYYAKNHKRRKAKDKLKLKKYNPNTRKHEYFIEKNFHHTVNNYFF